MFSFNWLSSSRVLKLQASMASEWSSLPFELLDIITKRIVVASDHLRFSAVCSSWRSVAVENRCHIPHQFPSLMIPGEDPNNRILLEYDDQEGDRGGYGFVDRGHRLPLPHNSVCRVSSKGWLIYADDRLDMYLLNPFSGTINQLPSIKALPPPRDHQVPLSLHWTKYELFLITKEPISRYYKGLYYLVESSPGELFQVIRDIGVFGSNYDHSYEDDDDDGDDDDKDSENGVEKSDKRTLATGSNVTVYFEVFKYQPCLKKWIRVKDLGNEAFFLGMNTSFSLPPFDFIGCKRNCIYFRDNRVHDFDHIYCCERELLSDGNDIGIFNLADGTIEPLYSPNNLKHTLPFPIWVSKFPW
ncbi:hypothetical protein GIB67_022181 [Kingdonia uniflora]|uniref:DUF295 domain-containing protein n=1 Tax=Kingdonia uniflora TaxID=39325 RepID=A0A7J7MVY1_9MAGN|nr:hypothetical protein GIB67_022181 [Kingdonia uniflora]